MKNMTRVEFIEYVKNLNLEELEDAAVFVNEYFNYYESLPEKDEDEKQLAWEKYLIALSKYGHMFVSFSLMVIELRKKMQEEMKYEVKYEETV